MKRLFVLCIFCVLEPASAEVYRCELAGGNISYQSVPCSAGKETSLGISGVATPGYPASAPISGGTGPEVVGSAAFQDHVHKAMALLRARDPDAYSIVKGYVGRIEQAARSGMRANADPPTFFLTEAAASHSVTWAAAVIAHDSYHSKLYYDYRGSHTGAVPRRAWGGTEAEIKCMRHQLAVMRRIGASQREIDHALVNADGHYGSDQGVD